MKPLRFHAFSDYLLQNLQDQRQQFHVGPLQIKGRMDVFVQSGLDVGVAQNLGKGFDLKSCLHAAGGEGMAQGVKIGSCDPSFLQIAPEPILHGPGFDHLSGGARLEVTLRQFRFAEWFYLLLQEGWNGNGPQRGLRFRTADIQFRAVCIVLLQPLHGPADGDTVPADVLPFQGTQLTNP